MSRSRPRARIPRDQARRRGYFGLGLVIAVSTVAIPPLLAPGHGPDTAGRPPAGVSATPAATRTATPVPPPGSNGSTVPTGPPASTAPARRPGCEPDPSAPQSAARPSCVLYGSSLGTGWEVTGDGVKVAPGRSVPGSARPAIRVDRRARVASFTFHAQAPVPLGPHTVLRFRLYGGREYGTILRITASADQDRPGSGAAVTVRAPAEGWADLAVSFTGSGLDEIRRIDLAPATDQLPQTYHFFLADLALTG